MTIGWVLPGGASLASVQVGQIDALMAAGQGPDLIVGTSAGSLNAAWMAADPTRRGAAVLRELWLRVSRREIFPLSPVTAVLGALGRRDHTVSDRSLRRWLADSLPCLRIEEARIPLIVAATDLATGRAELLRRGDLLAALVASCAVPGIFPPVEIDGKMLVDGGMAADVPIAPLAAAGADRIYVLPTLGPVRPGRPRGARDVAVRSLGMMFGNARESEIVACADRHEVFVLPVPPTDGVSPFSFRHGRRLMDEARDLTEAWLPVARPVEPGRPVTERRESN
ncbi:MAG: patatin-like phospholipase family protein [Actinomycetota bacterium]|nr:patatin-like phospholipase family protein [Actinomycetota bacterium]